MEAMNLEAGTPFWVSWSGGKDCWLALRRALQAGGVCQGLLCAFDESGQRSRSHGQSPQVLEAQARAVSLPLRTIQASWQTYEREFSLALDAMREGGVRDIVFGDIELQDHRDWEEKVCAQSQVRAHLPLWHAKRRDLLSEMFAQNGRAMIVGVREDRLGPEFLGRVLDWHLIAQIEALGLDACGEEGEFHTLMIDGAGFESPLQVLAGGAKHVEYNVRSLDVRLAGD